VIEVAAGTEPLDIERPGELVAWLRLSGRISPDETPAVRPLSGGVSNRAMVVRRPGGDTWVVKQALERLRVATVWRSSPERIHREAAGLRWIAALCGPQVVPELIFEDRAAHVIGMRYVPEPHDNLKVLLLAGRVDHAHVEGLGALLGRLHARAAGRLADIRPELGDRSFFESLRVEPYYAYSADRVPAAASFLAALVAETQAVADTLVHGDYSPKNVLVHDGRLVLLDHEVCHVGDPAFDVGFAICHLLSKGHALPAHRETFGAAASGFWDAYARARAAERWPAGDLEPRAARHGLGCLLARVAGRSPLEYLDDAARARQRDAVLPLLGDPPATVRGLAAAFLERVA
jgi:aminoglycoside phosphotransferase (APT) family kinase protein